MGVKNDLIDITDEKTDKVEGTNSEQLLIPNTAFPEPRN